ncbi:hypothetical protein ACFVXQ_27700, partial [Kitasatospora sp. NPDC058263]
MGRLARATCRELGATTTVQAVDIACRAGLLTPPPGDPFTAARVTGGQLRAFEPITLGRTHEEAACVLGIGRHTVNGQVRLLQVRIGARNA